MSHNIFRRIHTPALLAALAAGALALTGCAVVPIASAEGGHLRVVTSTTQLTDFAEIVGGADVTVSGLMPAGSSAHHFDPSPAQLLELARADVLIVNGQGLDTFVDGAIEASGFAGLLIDASTGVDLEAARAATEAAAHEAETAAEHAEHAEHTDAASGTDGEHGEHAAHNDEAADDHDHEPAPTESHDGHDHGASDLNPHLWTAPEMAAGMVQAVTDGLAAADPEHAAEFQSRAAAYQEQLTELNDWAAAQFARVPEDERVMVSGHDSLRYYLDAYGIAFAGSILPSFEDNAEPSVAEIDALAAQIRQRGVRAIFVEASMNPKLARTIARESGAKVIDGDPLAVDALGLPGSPTGSYLAATVYNTRIILEAWGYTPDPLPEALEKALQ